MLNAHSAFYFQLKFNHFNGLLSFSMHEILHKHFLLIFSFQELISWQSLGQLLLQISLGRRYQCFLLCNYHQIFHSSPSIITYRNILPYHWYMANLKCRGLNNQSFGSLTTRFRAKKALCH